MNEHESKNYYELLGIPQNASAEQIQKVYVDLSRIFGPDSDFYADIIDDPPRPEHAAMFDAITKAFNVLSDEQLRADYDRRLVSDLPGWDEEEAASAAQAPRNPTDGFDRRGAESLLSTGALRTAGSSMMLVYAIAGGMLLLTVTLVAMLVVRH